MSKSVHPYAHRLVILRDWKSRWFSAPKKFKDFLRGDILLRDFLTKKLRGFYVSLVEIERKGKTMRVIIKTSRPGMLIGKSGEGIENLRQDILTFSNKKKLLILKDFKLEVLEVTSPDADAAIVAYNIAEGLEKRMPYRRVIKQMVEKVMAAHGVEGVRVVLSGRLGGAEIARTEELKRGSIPLQTFRADIDFKRERATMSYGVVGIKVWIYRGKIFADKKKEKVFTRNGSVSGEES